MSIKRQISISERLSSPLWIIVLRVCLDVLYTTVVQPSYAYYGFKNEFSIARYLTSWVFLLLISFITNHWGKKEQVSYKIVIVLLYFGFFPATVMYSYMNAEFILYLLIYYIMLVFMVDILEPIYFKFGKDSNNTRQLVIDFFIIILLFNEIFIWARYAHFNIQLDLYNVYDVRSDSKSYSMPIMMYYIHSWARMLIPFFAIYYLHNKKKLMFSILLVLQFIIFSIDASKSSFFSMALSVGLYFLLKKGKSFIHYIPFGLSCVSLGAIAEKMLIGTTVITNYFIRRMMFFPSLLNYQYYEYFTIHGIDYYRRSIGGFFSQSLYTQDMADIIGQAYYRHAMHANNGLFADAYSNLGFVGVLIIPIMLAFVLKILDGSTRKVSPLVAQALVISYGFSLISSSFFTILLTHGLGIICVLGYFCFNRENESVILSK